MAKKKTKVKKKAVKKKSPESVTPEKKDEKPTVGPVIIPHPTAGKKVQDFEDVLDKQLAGDLEPAKRPVGRPPKEKEVEPEIPELTIDIVAGVVKIPFELWAISQGIEGLALTDEEAKPIAEPARQLLEYYLPQIPVIAYAWISVSTSLFWIMRSRLILIQEIRKQREKLQSPAPPVPAQPGVVIKFPDQNTPVKV